VGSFLNNANGGSTNGTIYYGGNYLSGVTLSHQQMTVGSMTSPIDFQGAQNILDALSSSLADTAANGTIIHKYSSYALNGTDAQSNVFNLTDTTYSGATITITAPAGSTVIVNVAGDADSFNGGSIVLNGVTADHVIFNFYAAKSLSVGSMAFNGTILAPFADFTAGWGQLNGQLIAKGAAGNFTFNEVLFDGNLDPFSDVTQTTPGGPNGVPGGGSNVLTPTPEPASWALAGLSLAIFGFVRMKRARVS
jgi:choice-of-anchor A domain-containing protein